MVPIKKHIGSARENEGKNMKDQKVYHNGGPWSGDELPPQNKLTLGYRLDTIGITICFEGEKGL